MRRDKKDSESGYDWKAEEKNRERFTNGVAHLWVKRPINRCSRSNVEKNTIYKSGYGASKTGNSYFELDILDFVIWIFDL